MDIRITPQTTLSRAVIHAREQSARLGKLQEQAATGKSINRPSDDPAVVGALLRSRAQDTQFDTYLANLGQARATLDQSVSTLSEASQVMQSARTLALEAAQSTNSPQSHEAIATQIDRLLERLIGLANTRQNGRYLYSGTASGTEPFVIAATNTAGKATQVSYQGSRQQDAVLVSAQQNLPTLYSGDGIFQLRARGATRFEGGTGAGAGSGTDNAIGIGTLQVRHTSTMFAPGSGVMPGAGSVAGDNLIGPPGAHQLILVDTSGTGAFGTVSLNGGPSVAFSSSDSNLVVTGPAGEIIHLNTTAVTPGFSGSVAITANGALSTDSGASFTPITFNSNQIVTHSDDGTLTNVDSTAIRRTGTERLEYAGTMDAFQALMALRDDLRNTRGLSSQEQLASLSRRVEDIDRSRRGILAAMGDQSANLENLELLEGHLRDLQLTTRTWISQLEDADLSEVVIGIQSQQNLLQLTLGATARIMDISLLDFLR